ncbi:LOC300675 protein, putative [Trichomonas vaginalis G3]|uniref:LOC300675 protein, putative n=2 Tax=Trichomonas vaginalis (strain ATCC PRA-98 / G3) TaxID=412133 RepID=A2G4P5_TRIV3|nr:LOC300675 protein, putative [Trichomonas vaginalis G3]|eukprot:XP_001300806.1 LOC300675 protein [Trichomonas vaginalis G3]
MGKINGSYGEFSPRPSGNDATTSNPELAQLFGLITSFQPEPIPIPPHFKPFLPDLIPAIGAIDAFIKVPRPDDEEEPLGLTVLDEPTIGCSDPQIVRMQLREKYGIVSAQEGDGYIGEIKDLENNQKALDTFLENYEEMIRDRPPPSIVYSYKMPDLNDLLDVWPEDIEKALESIPLPSADMDLTIEEYAKIICAFLDIPVKGNIIESLHVFFTLYMTFEENQHFPDNMPTRNSVSLQ